MPKVGLHRVREAAKKRSAALDQLEDRCPVADVQPQDVFLGCRSGQVCDQVVPPGTAKMTVSSSVTRFNTALRP